jgi:hypothetical protein
MTVAKLTGQEEKSHEKDKRTMVGKFDCSFNEYPSCQRAG